MEKEKVERLHGFSRWESSVTGVGDSYDPICLDCFHNTLLAVSLHRRASYCFLLNIEVSRNEDSPGVHSDQPPDTHAGDTSVHRLAVAMGLLLLKMPASTVC